MGRSRNERSMGAEMKWAGGQEGRRKEEKTGPSVRGRREQRGMEESQQGEGWRGRNGEEKLRSTEQGHSDKGRGHQGRKRGDKNMNN